MLRPTRRVLLLATTVILAANLFAAPGNDLCSSPSSISPVTSCPGTNTGTLYQATYSGPTSTCAATFTDVWFTFVMPASVTSADFSLSALGNGLTTTNTYIEVFNATTCASVTTANSLGCADAATGLSLSGLTAGGTYYLRVFTTATPGNSSKGNYSLCILYTPPPTNDDCGTATTLTIGTTNGSGTVWLASATSGIPTGCATGTPDDDVWYSFTATAANCTITLSSIGSDLSTSGARMQLLSGTACGSFVSVACGTTSISASSLTVGGTYYIRVYSAGAGSIGTSPSGSTFSILVSVSPGNDDCTGAYLLPTSTSTLTAEGTVIGATASSGIPIGACTGTPDDDVWFKFVATKTAPTITLTNLGSNLSATSRLQLLSGTCGSLASVACGTTSIAAASLTVGNTYFIRVYSSGATGLTANAGFSISVTDPLPAIVTDSTTTLFNVDTVGKNLGFPWEVTYGPDDSLWITEARGYRVVRMSASRTAAQKDAAVQQVLKIPLGGTEVTFGRSIGTWPQGGMEGLAIHPEFMTNPAKRWVYIAYVYSGTCAASSAVPCVFRSKIVRCQFYFAADAGNPTSIPHRDTLVILDTVISNLPGSNDHNSGRLKVGPVMEGGTYKLYYTIGDMGAGQFNNASRTNNAQNKDTCEGKILRLNTEPDLDPSYGVTHDYNTWRQWIPNDNPFKHSVFTTLPTPIFSYGHRNAQGLAWGQVNGTWRLYSSEHGDHSDDEVNIIESGKNYGWPKVAGVADDNYTTADDATDGYTFNNVLANQNVTSETAWAATQPNFKNPIFDFFNWNAPMIEPSNTGNIFNWPTIAPSSIDFYNGSIPGWKNSLLVTSLKYGMFRLKLNANGDAIDSSSSTNLVDTFPILHGWRVRDVAIHPTATSGIFWAVIDSSGSTSGPTGGFNGTNVNTKDGGKVLKLTYKSTLTLAVDFISFTGKLLPNKTILLNWVASVDQNHSYFDVEKKINGSWVTIGRVTSDPPYRFIDAAPLVGDNIYRIKELEFTGKADYSKIINVRYEPSAYIIAMYPNPVHDFINLRITSPGPSSLTVRIMDMQGKIVYTKAEKTDVSTLELSVPVRQWPSQMYMVNVIDKDGKTLFSEKLMKN
jgi:PQQ-dependent dehydrogenase (s-GDH family)